jgi:DNA-binding MarR family transcriptional regulator
MLLEFEFRSLSEIAAILGSRGSRMTLSGVLKHMKELEKVGLVRHEPGIFGDKPDARRTIYFLEGKERIEKILKRLENEVLLPLQCGVLFSETGRLARQIQGARNEIGMKDRASLESMLSKCETENIFSHLTEDEKKKLKLWRMMLSIT